jgi:hypothetical protein
VAKATVKTANKANKATKSTQKAIAKSVVDEDGFLHKVIVKANDKILPEVGAALGAAASTYLTGDPTMGEMVGRAAGQAGRNKLKDKTGYGVPGVGEHDKGNVDLEKTLRKYAPEYQNDFKHKNKPAVMPRGSNKKVNGRSIVVKQIMHEKGLSLPQASKYVKENNLWKK